MSKMLDSSPLLSTQQEPQWALDRVMDLESAAEDCLPAKEGAKLHI